MDSRLVPRLKEYLIDAGRMSDPLNINIAVDRLRSLYPEYGRNKRTPFLNAVQKAYDTIKSRDDSNQYARLYVPRTRRNKRKWTGAISEPTSPFSKEDSLASSEDEGSNSVRKGQNVMNQALSIGLYGPGQTQKHSQVNGIAEQDEANDTTPRKKIDQSKPKKQRVKANVAEDANDFDIVHPNETFDSVGGYEEQLATVCKFVLHMKRPDIYEHLGVTFPKGFLIHGPPGVGKTLMAHAIAGEFQLPLLKVSATQLIAGISGESEKKIRDLFSKAVEASPCILFIDEIDSVAPKRENAHREMERRIVSQLQMCLDDLSSKKDTYVLVIGATSRPDSLDASMRRADRFDKEIALGIPDAACRQKILAILCQYLKKSPDISFSQIAHMTPGYVGADLQTLVREASLEAAERILGSLTEEKKVDEPDAALEHGLQSNAAQVQELQRLRELLKTNVDVTSALSQLHVTLEDFQRACKRVVPSAKREGFITAPNVTWKDIGALQDIREELKWSILYPIKYPSDYASAGLDSKPQGLLLCGPPGCGKTLLAKAIANETGMNFISVKGPELLNMYVGESERAVRQVFQRGQSSSPCVIFFDELDALCPKRSEFDTGSSSRVVNQLLTEMDGMHERRSVFLIGATNRPGIAAVWEPPDIIDPAVLRPGRLDKTIFVGFPSPSDRADILRAITKNGEKPNLSSGVDINALSQDERLNRFSGADIAALVREASISALKSRIMAKMTPNASPSTDPFCVDQDHFEVAFQKIKASISDQEYTRYEEMRRLYGVNIN